jgi:hypothetical protein
MDRDSASLMIPTCYNQKPEINGQRQCKFDDTNVLLILSVLWLTASEYRVGVFKLILSVLWFNAFEYHVGVFKLILSVLWLAASGYPIWYHQTCTVDANVVFKSIKSKDRQYKFEDTNSIFRSSQSKDRQYKFEDTNFDIQKQLLVITRWYLQTCTVSVHWFTASGYNTLISSNLFCLWPLIYGFWL